MTRLRPARPALCAIACVTLAGTACSSRVAGTDRAGSGHTAVAITAGDKTCDVATTTLPAGRHTFLVTNTARQVTEVYVYAAGDRIVGEVENVGPSTTRSLIVELAGGTYEVACKPGMVGHGIRTALKVTGTTTSTASHDQNLAGATASYRRYVEAETQALVDTTAAFADAVSSGRLDRARTAYPTARLHYERIEPIAESFGDLDPLIDMRIDDVTGGQPFVGFHALERLLFQKKSLAGATVLASALKRDVGRLNQLVKGVQITPLTMANGAKSLLDEVAKSKVTGEEERYSRIDLVDFAGNVDGAKYAYVVLRPALHGRDPALVSTLDTRFRNLTGLLDTHRSRPGQAGYIAGSPYVSYDALTRAQVKALAGEVDAISEPLGRVSSVVTAR